MEDFVYTHPKSKILQKMMRFQKDRIPTPMKTIVEVQVHAYEKLCSDSISLLFLGPVKVLGTYP